MGLPIFAERTEGPFLRLEYAYRSVDGKYINDGSSLCGKFLGRRASFVVIFKPVIFGQFKV